MKGGVLLQYIERGVASEGRGIVAYTERYCQETEVVQYSILVDVLGFHIQCHVYKLSLQYCIVKYWERV